MGGLYLELMELRVYSLQNLFISLVCLPCGCVVYARIVMVSS